MKKDTYYCFLATILYILAAIPAMISFNEGDLVKGIYSLVFGILSLTYLQYVTPDIKE